MTGFSKVSSNRLASSHPDLQKIFEAVLEYQDCSIFCGHRTKEAQEEAFLNNKSKLRWPNSKHNSIPSMAVDAGPYFIDIRNTDWSDRLAFAVFAGRVLQVADELLAKGEITHRVYWGADWDGDGRTTDHKFLDLPHFELRAVT